MPRKTKISQLTHAVMKHTAKIGCDRPAGGVLHPIHGTVQAPIAVVGATGTIGKAVVGALVLAGQPVIAVAPDPARLEALRLAHPAGDLTLHPGLVRSDKEASRLARDIRRLGRPLGGAVVAIPAGAVGGRVLDRATDELRERLETSLLPQLAVARHLIPLLAESGRNGTYVMIGGPGSYAPWAGYGHRSIAMASLRMLARVLHDEAQPLDVRVHLLSIDSPVRGEEPTAHECPEWPSVEGVGRRVAQLVARTHTDESTQTIVSCRRRSELEATKHNPTLRFRDVPTFLKSLKTHTSQ
jgi:NAD(P)-dependent dehydrogenase (short-subunit alcohol dehydrogenase family)